MIKELDIVTLTRDIKTYGLRKGSRGAVVQCYQDSDCYEVEFTTGMGKSSQVLTLSKLDIQLEREAIQARVVEMLNSLPEDVLAEVRDFAEFLTQKEHHKVDGSGLFIHFSNS
ncbi:DUF4926 domain-containing protein [Leptothoe kymatousa]|uniref:DUF4926 domain-containing protein n=1 Tax=Leptothoe kymatousa TAU-MAC 1615 TaxID=2364775 RepID=A0ABS5Y005_9CYAN|nr:DUF4926 domain-containing protein [Leptothoe kymatousa]MBT9310814.1 DUF4926 domain-containing protein [Leptothoe kymatousa TAU-MAC 1615]